MSSLWFSVDANAVEEACDRMEWYGLALITSGVLGLLFGMFWVAFSGVCVLAGAGTPLYVGILFVAGGLGPLLGASVVLTLGISRRVTASRLRELRTLAHGRGGVSLERVTVMLGGKVGPAQALLHKACELGVAAPAAHGQAG